MSRQPKPKKGKITGKRSRIGSRFQIDREGKMDLPAWLMKVFKAKVGDEIAAWQEGESYVIAFVKRLRAGEEIPAHAYRTRIEPPSARKSAAKKKP
ncbi:MAG: hypothetical protein HC841_04525 [Verrucomicrobiae bacterium]|nr:hypothetical protein [Verrucomicrobiae bacterium]